MSLHKTERSAVRMHTCRTSLLLSGSTSTTIVFGYFPLAAASSIINTKSPILKLGSCQTTFAFLEETANTVVTTDVKIFRSRIVSSSKRLYKCQS